MNPGKILDTPSMVSHLRYGDQYQPADVPALFHYREQGGFRLAVEQCNGVGACRKLALGTMCPSYMATRDEEASTRGRANALRLYQDARLWMAEGVMDVVYLMNYTDDPAEFGTRIDPWVAENPPVPGNTSR